MCLSGKLAQKAVIYLVSGALIGDIGTKIAVGIALCTALAYGGYRKRALNRSGAALSWVFGFLIILLCDLSWFLLILIFFVSAAAATKYKYKAKEKLGAAEERLGARSWENVLANGMSPLLFVISEFVHPGAVFLAGYLGAVSTAMADTLSSEIGLTSKSHPWLITNFKRVKPGTHGAISVKGTAASLVGCLVLGLLGWVLGMEASWTFLAVMLTCVVGGMVGCTLDSVLGAVFELKGKMSNSQVNLVSTIGGGLAAIAVFLII